jgi:hypothetical protein
VTTNVDNGNNNSPTQGSLRAEILAANKAPGSTIEIQAGLKVITPPSPLPAVTADGTTGSARASGASRPCPIRTTVS